MIFLWMLLLLVAAVGVLVFGLWNVGRGLPEEHTSVVVARIKAPPREVWQTLSNFEEWPGWSPGADVVERLPDAGRKPVWAIGKGRRRMTVLVERIDAPRKLITKISTEGDVLGGTWTIEIAPDGASGTKVTHQEAGYVRPALFRAIAKHVLGHHRTQVVLLAALAKRLGDPQPKFEVRLPADKSAPTR